MVAVQLQTLWINEAANPSNAMSFPFMSGLEVEPAINGDVRVYGNGRRRAYTTGKVADNATATLPSCTLAQREWLQALIGQTVLVRDDRGRRLWATFFSVPVVEHAYNTDCDVSLKLTEVTYSDAV